MTAKSCSTCGALFECGLAEPGRDGWCPPCLLAEIKRRISAYVATVTPQTAQQSAARLSRLEPTGDTLVEDIDYELDGEGRLVFTAWYLLKRGSCCQSGCRHCPYGYRAP
jgi:hypothetical protein